MTSLPPNQLSFKDPAGAATCGDAGGRTDRRDARAGAAGPRPGTSASAGGCCSSTTGGGGRGHRPEQSGGRSVPLLDTRGTTGHGQNQGGNWAQPIGVGKLKEKMRGTLNRASVIAYTQELYVKAAGDVLARGGWKTTGQPLESIREADRAVLMDWAAALAHCGEHAIVVGQEQDGCTEVVLECCDVPPCPRHQRKASREWQKRAGATFGWFEGLRAHPAPRSREWVERAKRVQARAKGEHHHRLRRRIDAALVADEFARHPAQRWKHIEVGVHGHGLTRTQHIDKTLKLRAKLCRVLKREYGATAIFAALDQGTAKQSPHLHLLVLCDYVPRDVLQRWLRSTDCTVAGCSHEADDRCPKCKREGHRCDHARADGKPRCDGSWYVHVEQIGAKCPVCKQTVKQGECCGTIYKERVRKGFVEVLKYASAPVEVGNAPQPGRSFNARQLQHAEQVLQFYLVSRGRHRIETYGAAKLDLVELGLAELPEDAKKDGCCEHGLPWTHEAHGWRVGGMGYRWGKLYPYNSEVAPFSGTEGGEVEWAAGPPGGGP